MSSPILSYTNWLEWSEFWKDHLMILDLWQFVDPDSTVDPSDTAEGREIAKLLRENIAEVRQHVSPECWRLMGGQTTARYIWAALKAGCDRGTTLPLMGIYEAFHNERWEANDTIATYTGRLRNHFLALESSEYRLNDEAAVLFLVDRLPDAYSIFGKSVKQLKLPFIEATKYLLDITNDATTAGDNASGQALIAPNRSRGRRPNRKPSLQSLRSRDSVSSDHRSRSSRGPRTICNWCKRKGHYERTCRIRKAQLDSGAAKMEENGRVYLPQQAQYDQQTQQPYLPPHPHTIPRYPRSR
ncbi:hypothetical protein BJX63DRAFT_431864 [Aspergillus granulosus]|uniref:Uncharacterized protein n=1 Tax=Aspergillus granulosus TaxID=176169 RepID=A0ABR4HDE8_9EURO